VIEYSFTHDPGVITSTKVKAGVPQLSVAVGVVHDGVKEHSMVEGAGKAEMVGGVLSSKFITCEVVAVFPQASVATHVLVIVYSLVQAPDTVAST
jgi:uncharacterized membrane protein YdcZ (DUF606 family)